MERAEEYLEAIYDLQKNGKVAKTGDLAKILKVKPASVTEMLLKLKEMGYVDYNPYKGAILTKSGEEIAKRIKRHYNIASNFFKFIGIEDDVAEKLGCELEHHMNDEVADRLSVILGFKCGGCEREIKRLKCVSDGIYEVVSSPNPELKVGELIKVEKGKFETLDGFEVREEILDLVLVRRSL
ncbi:MAG: metal-dependent transcriptional regulator [Archaeoglobaceae archaeon]|nr:metal-dependent transcriptional regulator [Archaeoglobaceae archaeon]MDW8127605.1 metal-dependent transcriptional regulator [Archaeoglobaceae archaeon]